MENERGEMGKGDRKKKRPIAGGRQEKEGERQRKRGKGRWEGEGVCVVWTVFKHSNCSSDYRVITSNYSHPPPTHSLTHT